MRPITAQPGHTEEETEAALRSGQFVFADCYTFEPKVGDKLRYTTAQRRVSVVPVDDVVRRSYEAQGVIITGLRVMNQLGVEVDQQEVNIDYVSSPIFQNYLTWPEALLQGKLDGARIRRDRYIAKAWDPNPMGETDWLGGMPMFNGLVSSLNGVGRQSASMSVKSDLVLLNIQMPQYLFETNCKNTWGDPICGVVQNDWAVAGTMGPAPTRSVIPWSGVSAHYNQGKVYVENEDSVTLIRTISRVDADNLYLSFPLDFDPMEGQEFTAYPGCPRTMDATYGCPKYHGSNWEEFFKGFPFVPVAETAL